jgi:hypothetical protein
MSLPELPRRVLFPFNEGNEVSGSFVLLSLPSQQSVWRFGASFASVYWAVGYVKKQAQCVQEQGFRASF